ncbi:hypothetical protein [Spirosoma koreense]
MRPPFRRRRFGFFPLFILLALLAVSYVVYWLWNNVLVVVTGVRTVTLWQAMGLLILARILFGGFRFGPRGGPPSYGAGPNWRSKWHQMTDEERSKFKDEWRKWRRHDS